MLMFAFVFGGAMDTGATSYIEFVAPGVILTCAGYGASSTGVGVATDLHSGLMDRFRTMPIHASTVVTGHVVSSLVRNLVATAVVFAVAVTIGFRPAADAWEWIQVGAVIALYILAITYLFAAIGLASGNPEAANGYGFILLFLPYLSSGYVPISTMPSWLQGVATYQPATPLIDSVRALLDGATPGNSLPAAVAWCLGILLAAILWARWVFARNAGRR
jgi:ABC-2 type transport system permease protein